MNHRKSRAMLVLRIVTGALFIYHGLPKLIDANEGMIGFVGGAFHDLGLTFLSQSQWLMLLGTGEVVLGLMLIIGLFSARIAPLLMIIMLGAINIKGWSFQAAELDFVLLAMLVTITVGGSGRYSTERLICGCSCSKDGACCKDKKAE